MASPPEPAPGPDPELESALKRVLHVIHKDHALSANQILTLAAEVQKLGVHRLVEEHLARFERRAGEGRS